MDFTETQIQRYARHILLPDIGGVGQRSWLSATVAVEVGAGDGAATTALLFLAAGGVGHILLTGDPDRLVSACDLGAGIMYRCSDVGTPRRAAIRRRIAEINPDCQLSSGPADGQPTAELMLEATGDNAATVADALIRGGSAAARLMSRLART